MPHLKTRYLSLQDNTFLTFKVWFKTARECMFILRCIQLFKYYVQVLKISPINMFMPGNSDRTGYKTFTIHKWLETWKYTKDYSHLNVSWNWGVHSIGSIHIYFFPCNKLDYCIMNICNINRTTYEKERNWKQMFETSWG